MAAKTEYTTREAAEKHPLVYGPDKGVPDITPGMSENTKTMIRLRRGDPDLLEDIAQTLKARNRDQNILVIGKDENRWKLRIGKHNGEECLLSCMKRGNVSEELMFAPLVNCGQRPKDKGGQPGVIPMTRVFEINECYDARLHHTLWSSSAIERTQAGVAGEDAWREAWKRSLVRIWAYILPHALIPKWVPPSEKPKKKTTDSSSMQSTPKKARGSKKRKVSDGVDEPSGLDVPGLDGADLDKRYGCQSDDQYWTSFNKRKVKFDLRDPNVCTRLAEAYIGCTSREEEGSVPQPELLIKAYETATRAGMNVDKTIPWKNWMNESSGRSNGGTEIKFMPSLETREVDEAREAAAKSEMFDEYVVMPRTEGAKFILDNF